jgi:hypothetical protein
MHADVQGFSPHQIPTVFQLVQTAKFCKTLTMAMKQWGLDLDMKFETKCLYETSSSSKTKTGRNDGLTQHCL